MIAMELELEYGFLGVRIVSFPFARSAIHLTSLSLIPAYCPAPLRFSSVVYIDGAHCVRRSSDTFRFLLF